MNPPVPEPKPSDLPVSENPGQWLSALADGEAQALHPGCAVWRDDVRARQTWHAYQLIGDVLRSDELAASAPRDAAFLSAVRSRLAAEPALPAPNPAPLPVASQRGPHHAWLAPLAMAAGVAAVAGVLVLTRLGLPGAAPAAPGQALAPVLSSDRVPVAVPSGVPAPMLPGAGLIRNAGLDSYLHAHQAERGNGAAAVPGGMLTSVDVMLPPGAPR